MSDKVIDTWFTSSIKDGMGIGFILVEGATGKRKIFCGPYNGANMDADVQNLIEKWGAPLRVPQLSNMLSRVTETGNFK